MITIIIVSCNSISKSEIAKQGIGFEEPCARYCEIVKFEEKVNHLLITINEVAIYGEVTESYAPVFTSRNLGHKTFLTNNNTQFYTWMNDDEAINISELEDKNAFFEYPLFTIEVENDEVIRLVQSYVP